jgi:hypothetical protein
MASVGGELEAGEAQGTMAAIAARQRGSRLFYYGAIVLLMVLGAVIGATVGWAFEARKADALLNSNVLGVVGLWVGWFVYVRICRPLVVRRFKKNMRDRGLDVRFPYGLKLADDGLTLTCGGVMKKADWGSVTEVFKVKGYWVILVQMEPWFAPVRFFSSPADEKSFVRSVVGRLSEGARGRSKAAVAFAGV